jgi:hypothetical protein
MMLSHQIDDEESTNSLNNGQHEILGPDLLPHLLRDIIPRYLPCHRTTEFQSELTLVSSDRSLKIIFLMTFENG